MFERLLDRDERGQVGIETLVIFIALILVAAVAAGVLINTTGFLQNKASATSDDATAQVSNQVVVVSAIGEVPTDNTNITELNLTVMQSAGAEEIDLSGATIEWIGPNGHSTLIYEGNLSDGTATGNFTTLGAKDPDASLPVLNEQEDRFVIHIPLSKTDGDTMADLKEGQQATIRIVTQSGSTYTYVVNVPESLTSDKGSAVAV